jgi:hypothetical protein
MGELVSFEGQRARTGAAIRYSAARDLPKIDFTEGLIATFMAE